MSGAVGGEEGSIVDDDEDEDEDDDDDDNNDVDGDGDDIIPVCFGIAFWLDAYVGCALDV